MTSVRKVDFGAVISCGLLIFIVAAFVTPSTKVYRDVFFLLVLGPVLLYLLVDGGARRLFCRLPAMAWFLAFAGWLWLSTLINDGVSIELILLFKPIACLAAFLFALVVASAHADRAMVIGAAKTIVLVAAVSGCFMLCWFYSSHPLTTRLKGFGPLENEIRVAALYGFVVLVACFLWTASYKAWAAPGLIVGALVVYFAQSRGVLISLSTAMVVYLLSQLLVNRVLIVYPLAFLGLLLLLLLVLAATGHQNRLFTAMEFRPAIWREGLKMAQESWIIGHGLLASTEVSTEYGKFGHFHCGYLSVFYQGGVIALVICAVGVLMALINAVRGRQFLLLAMLVFGLMYLVSDGGTSPITAPRDIWIVVFFPLFLLLSPHSYSGWEASGAESSPKGWQKGARGLALRN